MRETMSIAAGTTGLARPVDRHPRKHVTHILAAASLACLMAILPVPAALAADDYLSALEAEADDLQIMGAAKKEHEKLKQQGNINTGKATTPGTEGDSASQLLFEQGLRDNFPSSFALYAKLKQSDKDKVYGEYKNSTAPGWSRYTAAISKVITISTQY